MNDESVDESAGDAAAPGDGGAEDNARPPLPIVGMGILLHVRTAAGGVVPVQIDVPVVSAPIFMDVLWSHAAPQMRELSRQTQSAIVTAPAAPKRANGKGGSGLILPDTAYPTRRGN
jgi:hypothetical protein